MREIVVDNFAGGGGASTGIEIAIGRSVGGRLGDEINGGQASFQKNTALSIWVAYTYLTPMASVGAGCYVLWQNIINSLELWQYRKKNS